MASSRLAALLIALSVAGCGGSSAPATPVAQRICGAAATAAGSPGRVRMRIQSRDAANVVCAIRSGRVRMRVVSQAVPQAYTEFDTETSHQSQVYGSGTHQLGRTPFGVTVPGASAAVWVPAQGELIATSGSPTRQGGAYVTITVSHASGRAARSLALTVGRAVFGAHPAA